MVHSEWLNLPSPKDFATDLPKGSAYLLWFCSIVLWTMGTKETAKYCTLIGYLLGQTDTCISVGCRRVAYSRLKDLLLVNPVSLHSLSPYQLIYLLKMSSVNAPQHLHLSLVSETLCPGNHSSSEGLYCRLCWIMSHNVINCNMKNVMFGWSCCPRFSCPNIEHLGDIVWWWAK